MRGVSRVVEEVQGFLGKARSSSLIAMFGWAGLFGAVPHIGSLMLFSRWK